jgi:hypothetical protein
MAEAALDIPVTAPNVVPSMERTHARVAVTPNDEAQLAYDFAIPKSWAYAKQFGPTESGLLVTQGLGMFTPTSDPDGPVVAATVTTIPFEVPIDTWSRLDLGRDGWEIVAGSWFPGAFGLFYDLTAVRKKGASQQVRRTSVRVRGTQVFALNTLCGRAQWDAVKEIFWVAHSSFELSMKGPTRMEPWYGGIAERPDFQIAYSASWSAEAKSPELDQTSLVDVRLLDAEKERLLGYLQVKAERRAPGAPVPPVEVLQAGTLELLKGADLVPRAAPELLASEQDPRAIEAADWLGTFVCDGMMKGGRVLVRTGFLDRKGQTFTFTAIGPLLSDDELTALRTQRAFEIARATLVMP